MVSQLSGENGVVAAAGRRSRWRWLNRSVNCYEGKVGELRELLPTFRRRSRGGVHEIIRDTFEQRVVAEVSPSYVLVQHHELLAALPDVLDDHGYVLDELDAELNITTCGARMELVINLPFIDAMPADAHPLGCRLRCLNSVDRTTAMEAELQWCRLICSNGMFGWSDDGERLRRVHRYDESLLWLENQLRRRFRELPQDRMHFDRLLRTPVDYSELEDWADVFLARSWGKSEAARVLYICRTGRDGEVQPNLDDEQRAREMQVVAMEVVPGACAPVNNLYHVGQALSWVAARADTMNKQFSRLSAVPRLLRRLMN
jgi:hypothetical protein